MIALYILIGLVGLLLILIAASIISWDLSWAMLHKIEDMPNETLKKKHDDWPWGFRWVPRRLTAFLNGPDKNHWYPVQLLGTNTKEWRFGILEQDVPGEGQWCISWPPHFSMLTKGGTLIRFGVFRKDYWDPPTGGYWVFLAFGWHKNK